MSVPILVDFEELFETTFQLCGSPRQRFGLIAEEVYWTEEQEEVPFARWERMNTVTGEWETISGEPFLSTTMVNGASFRAVYGGEEWSITATPTPVDPRPEPTEVCLSVDAVFVYREVMRTGSYGQTVEYPLSVQIAVNQTQYQTTKFALCAPRETQFYLQAPTDHFAEQQYEELAFSHWERYDTIEQAWIPFAEAVMLRVTLQSGGQLRAVYHAADEMY